MKKINLTIVMKISTFIDFLEDNLDVLFEANFLLKFKKKQFKVFEKFNAS